MTTLLHDIFNQSVEFLNQHDLFYGHGVAVAEDEAVLLMMHVLQVDFATMNQMHREPVSCDQERLVRDILQQRVTEQVPMAYLVGFAVFAGLKFQVDDRVLIPRSPFVELIDGGFEPWVNLNQTTQVMDMCTGSGCIGLAIAHYFQNTQVDLVDVSQDALQLAAENTDVLKLSQRVRCIESDLFSAINCDSKHSYDLIAANPPYVAENEYLNLPTEYSHEPKMALVSAFEGMELPVKILFQAPDYMSGGGYLFLEVGYNDDVLSQCLPNVHFEWLTFNLGGQGICVFNRSDLLKYRAEFKEFLESHVA